MGRQIELSLFVLLFPVNDLFVAPGGVLKLICTSNQHKKPKS